MVNELMELLGKEAVVTFGEAAFFCVVSDARVAYGKTQVCLRPRAGMGSIWKDADGVRIRDVVKGNVLDDVLLGLEKVRTEGVGIENPPADYVVRVCQAVVASAAGYPTRSDWQYLRRRKEGV